MVSARGTKLGSCVLAAATASLITAAPARADQPAPPAPENAPARPEGEPVPPPPPNAANAANAPTATAPPEIPVGTPTVEAPPTPPADAAGRWRYTAMLGVLSAPRVLALQPMGRYRRADDPRWDLFALGAAIEYLPPGLASFGGPKLSWMQLAVEGKWFPWRMLFVGARAGWQFVRADSEKYGSDVTYVTSGVIVGANIGALYNFSNGLTLGGDLGFTAPIAPKTTLDSDGQADSGSRKVAKTFGMFVMPALALRVGYTF
jgi:hypothetical protein